MAISTGLILHLKCDQPINHDGLLQMKGSAFLLRCCSEILVRLVKAMSPRDVKNYAFVCITYHASHIT